MNRAPSVIQGRKIKFGVVGCGRISANHFASLKKHSDRAELVAVCDIDRAALDAAVLQTGARGFSSLDVMLKEADLDVVSVCTPSGLHPEHSIQIARSGRHVVSEKPMSTNLEDAREMIRVCEQEGRRLFVVKQNRRNATLQLLKKAVDEGRFGKIYLVNVNVLWSRPDSYFEQAPWRGTWKMDGGIFFNQASHYVDLLHWLIGPVEKIHAYYQTFERKIETEDTGVVNLKWKSGTLGTMMATVLTYPKNLEGSITILGEKGTARIGGVAVNEIQVWDFADRRPEDASVKEASYETTSVYGFGHPLYYDNVIRVLRGEAEPETDGREGLRTMELLVGIQMSARTGEEILLNQ